MTIVASVDDEERSKAVVKEAATLADRFDEPLHVVSVYEDSEHDHLLNEKANIDEKPTEEDRKEIARTVAERASDGISREREVIGRTGNPAEEILNYATEVDSRYLVLGGRKRSPVGKALFGSITQSILLDADRPVVAVMDGN
ncbi:universal stress protein [Halostagnicola kamekurae]|uniref:Nucleotide-binding universal stress protein, UspA family n=1 Tax=Halostagnicola kamekurae TaxID=619731 RepID=A0A1I6TWR2_9EURY|nr:universal stress protein [Halostagnicola kamekurae]SFS93447.1 Nucleotide-binding universal stress protein, UspA family [Halostagnicola kamekurae]